MTPEEILTGLGFNSLEARIYTFLLGNEAMTAYAIARALHKQNANVYKAIEVLASRGAVWVEDGSHRLCRAVPVEQFIRQQERDFLARTKQAREELSNLYRPTFDERVYRVETVAQIMEKASDMLASATSVVMVDAFPKSIGAMLPALRKCIRRGVAVYVQGYSPIELEGATSVVIAFPGSDVMEFWRSEQLNLVVDGREHLIALLSESHDQVHQATWSRSLYLSCLLHSGLMSEHTIHRLLHAGTDTRAVTTILKKHRMFLNSTVPGQQELSDRMTGNAPQRTRSPRKKEKK